MTPPSQQCRHVWIIGARGMLGAALRAHLPQETVTLFDPAFRAGEGGRAARVQAPGAMEGAPAPDAVIFCAATHGGDAAAYRSAYVEPVQAVAAAAPGARLVFCSSVAVYEAPGVAATEESPTPGSSERLRVLLEAEQAALAAGGVVARLAPLYGPARCELLRRHLAGEPRLPGPPERMLNYLHVESAVESLLRLSAAPHLRHRIYNLCDESFTHAQAYALLESLTGIPSSREMSAPGRHRGSSDHRVIAERIRELVSAPARPFLFEDFVRSCSGRGMPARPASADRA